VSQKATAHRQEGAAIEAASLPDPNWYHQPHPPGATSSLPFRRMIASTGRARNRVRICAARRKRYNATQWGLSDVFRRYSRRMGT